jgi:hypothetical protein
MARITDTDLQLIRDEIGTSTPPTDDDLDDSWRQLGHWLPVAVRVLKRRRADIAAGGQSVQSLNLAGAISVGFGGADLRTLDAQILRLEARWEALTGAPPVDEPAVASGRLHRADTPRRRW